jgi:hypothetical protein
MKFSGMEHRLNPIVPDGVDETTLGGYAAIHGRAPGFEGLDGCAYTAAVETDTLDSYGEDDVYAGFIVFVRWADQGSAIMGHIESEDLDRAPSPEEARRSVEELPLTRVKEILDDTIRRKRGWEMEAGMRLEKMADGE